MHVKEEKNIVCVRRGTICGFRHPLDFLTYIPQGQREATLLSIQFSCSVVSDSLRPHELQHTRPPCPSPTPRVHPNPCPSSQ